MFFPYHHENNANKLCHTARNDNFAHKFKLAAPVNCANDNGAQHTLLTDLLRKTTQPGRGLIPETGVIMGKSVILLAAALLLGNVAANAAQARESLDEQADALTQPQAETRGSSYELKEFTADFRAFKPGDIVPELYRSKPYEIEQWSQRNLPAPEPDSHWTYMGGNYVLITNAEGKILRAMSGDIFYQR
jgi:Ni/Co efflux regulator RcnB